MKKFYHFTQFLMLGLALMFMGGCQPIAAPANNSASATTYTDPFAYCAAVGTIDAPDASYTGEKMPESILKGLVEKGVVTADAPAEIQAHATWRCMDSQVWVCHYGANIPCDTKADTSQTPTAGMDEFCKANANSDFIPAVATGRATVYNWSCKDGKAVVGKQILEVDAQGYLAQFWYELSAP